MRRTAVIKGRDIESKIKKTFMSIEKVLKRLKEIRMAELE
jgi:hypothetical protein